MCKQYVLKYRTKFLKSLYYWVIKIRMIAYRKSKETRWKSPVLKFLFMGTSFKVQIEILLFIDNIALGIIVSTYKYSLHKFTVINEWKSMKCVKIRGSFRHAQSFPKNWRGAILFFCI